MRRVVVLSLVGFVLIGLWLSILLVPRDRPYRPIFLASALLASAQESNLKSAPFVKKIAPQTTENLGTSGVSCCDYLLPGSFGDIQKQANAELATKEGWELFYSAPEKPATNKFIPVRVMDALYMRGNDAVTIYREPVEGLVRVRVWHRSPSMFAHLF